MSVEKSQYLSKKDTKVFYRNSGAFPYVLSPCQKIMARVIEKEANNSSKHNESQVPWLNSISVSLSNYNAGKSNKSNSPAPRAKGILKDRSQDSKM